MWRREEFASGVAQGIACEYQARWTDPTIGRDSKRPALQMAEAKPIVAISESQCLLMTMRGLRFDTGHHVSTGFGECPDDNPWILPHDLDVV